MATVTLHEYIARIEALLHEEAYERAISLCQYGLRSYPRCVDFYRLLGQSCLETDRPDDAADMFRRVLGVDPQNFVARVGLGVVAEGIGAVDEALWQWERALELEPNHAAVRDEWQQLRAKRDNISPGGRMKLNRAALGYIYMRGEQYERAAGEFRTVLAGIPADADGKHERFDLQVALAEALYRGGRQREAGELCRQVLKILPNALKANLILGDIDLETGREDEGRVLFEQAQVLDPENLMASQLLHPPVRLPMRAITLEEPGSATMFSPMPEQAASPGFGVQEPTETSQTSEPLSPEDEGLPDWLRTLRVHRANVAPARVERFEADKAPEWLQEVADVNLLQPPVAPAPDVAPVAQLEASQVDLEAHVPSTAVAAPETPVRAPEPMAAPIPDWLSELRPLGAKVPEPEPLHAAIPEAVETPGATPIPAAGQSDEISEAKLEAPPALQTVKPQAAAAEMSAEAVSPHVSTTVPEAAAEMSAEAVSPHVSTAVPEAAAEMSAEAVSPHVSTTVPEAAAEISAEAVSPHVSTAVPEAAAEMSAEAATPHVSTTVPEAAAQTSAEVATPHVSVAEPQPPAPEIGEPHPLTKLSEEPELPVTTVLPAHTPRDVTAFLDDSSALPAVESQEAPIAEHHPEAIETLQLLRAAQPLQPAPAGPISAVSADVVPPSAVDDAQSGAPGAGLAESAHSSEAPSAAAAPSEAPADAFLSSAGAAYLVDAEAPASIETQVVPTVAAQYAARLELARMLVDLDLDTALDQYELMLGAGPTLLQHSIADLVTLTVSHAEVEKTHAVLNLLQGSLPQPLSQEASLVAPVIQTPGAPLFGFETLAPVAPESPEPFAVSSASVETTAAMDAASVAADPIRTSPPAPVVSEETMEAATTVEGGQAPTPTLPVVDASLADAATSKQAPHEAVDYLADSAAPETHAAPATTHESSAAVPVEPPAVASAQMVHEALIAAVAPEGTGATQLEQQVAKPKPASTPREATAILDEASAPPAVEAQPEPLSDAEPKARLARARALREISLQESAAQYQSLIDGGILLPQIISDLQSLLQAQPGARNMRMLLAEALAQAGKHQEAVEQYRKLV